MKRTLFARTIMLAIGVATLGCGDGATTPDAAGPAADAAAAGGCAPVKSAAADPALVAAGLALVQSNKCQQCHGSDLSGNFDGVLFPGHAMPAYPPNLTPDAATGLGCWSDAQIAKAILDGSDDQGQPICPPMPHFSKKGLGQSEALTIVAFLRSLPPATNQVPSTASCQPWGTLGGGCEVTTDCPSGTVCAFQFCVSDGDGNGGDGGSTR
jgi:mono/diheme cytochrome c family protein